MKARRIATRHNGPGRFIAAALAAFVLASCAGERQSPRAQATATGAASYATASQRIGFLAVGDTGYDYAFLEPQDRTKIRTREQFVAHERQKWIEDRRPLEDFALPAMHRLADTGGFVNASGLMPVAHAMRTFCGAARCDFALMLGDNIYPNGATAGADGIDDTQRFRKLFLEPYVTLAAGREDFAIYVALGNHDWKTSRAGVLSQLHFHENTRPFYMKGLFYKVSPPAAHGLVDIFVIDTEMMLAGTTVHEATLADDGSEIVSDELERAPPWAVPRTDAERGMQTWLEESLRESRARWKIVIGHHPLWSSAGTKFEQARALRALILPALCRYADMYVAGHEHTLELHLDDCAAELGERAEPLLQIVSGAGSKQRPLNRAFMRMQSRSHPQLHTIWARGLVWGFAHVTLEGDRATVRMITTPNEESGKPVEEFVYSYSRRSGSTAEEHT